MKAVPYARTGARPDPGRVSVQRAGRGPLCPDYLSLSRTFTQLVRASGLPPVRLHDLPPVRLHDLRHGAASLDLAAGVDLAMVADLLGHCSIVSRPGTRRLEGASCRLSWDL